ncbi:hypothetical protein VMT65_21240 [Nocardia sp. CDC153]|uniref:hypothetical protein n=1 Tax=Nocardia sp. CDC153 TaxID=3112167 RepID=UPI002DB97387|nr:hypothetical protein [Nocardia sp. CDC153]MEC3955578.1 hypothetical protein [Nocardia sp. CDC153]
MSSGNNDRDINHDRDIDPEKTTSSGDWWQGVPGRGYTAPYNNPPPPIYPHPSPNPYAPYQSGPNPIPPVQNPYATGPNMVPPNATGGYPPPPSGGRGGPWLLVGAGALVVVIAAVIAIVVVVHDSGNSAAPTSSAAATSTSRATTSAPRTTAPATSTLTPQIPGYQVDVPKNLKAAWDIPKDWSIDQSTTIFGTNDDNIPAVGYAQEGEEYCPNNVRTTMFLTTSDIDDATAAATDVGAHAARIGYSTKTSLTAGTAQPLDTTDGPLHGVFLETKGGFTAPAGCATTYSVYTFAIGVGTGKGSLVLTLVSDTGVDRSVTADFARKLFATFRLL